jgi:hypothetical protein
MPGTERERVATSGHPEVGLVWGDTLAPLEPYLSERAWGTVRGQAARGLGPVDQWAAGTFAAGMEGGEILGATTTDVGMPPPDAAAGRGGPERLRREQAS